MNYNNKDQHQLFSQFLEPYQQASPIGYSKLNHLNKKDSLDVYDNDSFNKQTNNQQQNKIRSKQFSQQVYQSMKQLLPQIEKEIRKQIQTQFEQQFSNIKIFYQKQAQRIIAEKQFYLRKIYDQQIQKIRIKAQDHAEQRIKQTLHAWKQDHQSQFAKNKLQNQAKERLAICQKKNKQLLEQKKQYQNELDKMIKKLQLINKQRIHWCQQQLKYSSTIRQLTQRLTQQMQKNNKKLMKQRNIQVSKWNKNTNKNASIYSQHKKLAYQNQPYYKSSIIEQAQDNFQLNSKDFQQIQNFESNDNQDNNFLNGYQENEKVLQKEVQNKLSKQNKSISNFSAIQSNGNTQRYFNHNNSQNKNDAAGKANKLISNFTQRRMYDMPLKLKQRQVSLQLNKPQCLQSTQKSKKQIKNCDLYSTLQKQKKIDILLYDSKNQQYQVEQTEKQNIKGRNQDYKLMNSVLDPPETSFVKDSQRSNNTNKVFWDVDKKRKLLQMIRQKL